VRPKPTFSDFSNPHSRLSDSQRLQDFAIAQQVWAAEAMQEAAERIEVALAHGEPPKLRKPFPTSLTPPPCDCDLYGVVHVMQTECPVWKREPS
jgi:hypothetical protein